jgi:hypothetical protein
VKVGLTNAGAKGMVIPIPLYTGGSKTSIPPVPSQGRKVILPDIAESAKTSWAKIPPKANVSTIAVVTSAPAITNERFIPMFLLVFLLMFIFKHE